MIRRSTIVAATAVLTACPNGTYAMCRPNYEACSPPLLQPGVPLTMPGATCGTEDPGRAFVVVAFDAVAGTTYTLDGPSLMVYNSNGERAGMGRPGLTFDESGRYYVVFSQNRAVTIMLSEQ